MEALCRLAVLKGLPTANELEASGFDDAGAFLIHLQDQDAQKHKEFISDPTRHAEWGEDPPKGSSLAMRLEGLILLIIRTIEQRVNFAGANEQISPDEIKKFVKINQAQFKARVKR